VTARRYRRVLAEINLIRAELRLPPITEIPKGNPEESGSCPIARGLGDAWVDAIQWGARVGDTDGGGMLSPALLPARAEDE
jgi:hypothetical protein